MYVGTNLSHDQHQYLLSAAGSRGKNKNLDSLISLCHYNSAGVFACCFTVILSKKSTSSTYYDENTY